MALRQVWTNTREWLANKLKPDEFAHQELPEFVAWRGMMKSYDDPAYRISSEAYTTILRNDVILQPMIKFAERLSGMQLTVVGSGKLRDELQKIVDRASGVGDMLYWLSFAKIEGVRFMQHRAVFDEELDYYVPDFRGCGARKWKAGGVIYWEGWRADQLNPKRSIGKIEELGVGGAIDDPLVAKDAVGQWYDRDWWTVFRPGAGSNPEGDIEQVLQLFLIAEAAQLLDKAMRIYADRYSLPRELLKEMIDKVPPDEVVPRLRSGADKMARSTGRRRSSMPMETVIELLEPEGNTWEFLTSYRELLERRVTKLIWGEDLSMASTEGGDRGGKQEGSKQSYASLVSFGQKIADALSNDWLPWLIELNKDQLPKLKKSEPFPYISLRPPAEKQRLTVAELKSVADMKIPVLASDVYGTIGCDIPPDAPDVFDWSSMNPDPMGMNPDGTVPSNTGESEQRKDREQEDSGMPAEKPQEDSNDQRNLPKE